MKKPTKIIAALTITLFVSLGIVLGISTDANKTEKLKIVATNFPAYDFARAVTSGAADIKMLTKPGTEIHDFEPTPEDIIAIKNSDLFIYNGGESDEWIEDILDDVDTNKTKFLKMMDSIKPVEEEIIHGMEDEHENGLIENKNESTAHGEEEPEYDEHIWTSPKNASMIIGTIKNELIKLSPTDKQNFENNANDYTDKLEKLDSEFKKIVKEGNRKTLVFGDRFPLRYFVDEYGLNYFAAFPGCSDQTEASSKTIAFLIDKIKTEGIPVIFKIEMSNGELAKTIAEETGAKILTFDSAHNISFDNFKNGRTYIDIMTDNLKVLKEALE